MKTLLASFLLTLPLVALANEPSPTAPPPAPGAVVFRELRYDVAVSDAEARFTVEISAESTARTGAVATLFEGELALLPPKLPSGLRLEREANVYRLFVTRPGSYQFQLEGVARVNRAEPWNQVSFVGPSAAIAAVTAQAKGSGVELQLLTGTVLESAQTNGVARVRGFLGAEPGLCLRWQSRATEIARRAVVAAESTVAAHITPTVVKYSTQFRYDVIQGALSKLTLALPATHALTRLGGEQIRDWSLAPEGDRQVLTIEFIKPIEKAYALTVLSEQTVETAPTTVSLSPPQPLDAERESGQLTVSAEDMQVAIESTAGLRQINAPTGALAAYRFSARPLALALRLQRIEPVVTVSDRATVRLEETRLLASHELTFNVTQAGIYALVLLPQTGFVVAAVRGEGVDDWKVADGQLKISFHNRVLGALTLEVQLEQPLKTFPERVALEPLRVAGATKETVLLGAASAAGLRVKTAEVTGLREVPVNRLLARTDELLAFTAENADWKLTLATERLAARVVAEVFNLITIGDGLVGGSATIRYGLINQGVQEFQVRVPANWKNLEFTGPNIRRKEVTGDVWTIGLQDKAWGGYTLVVTYDYAFDPHGATLPVGGLHPLAVERETGSIAITTAASLKLQATPLAEPLRRVDEAELAAADRALITRSVLLAYQYTGDRYDLSVNVQRFESSDVLSAVADRTQLTSVLTDAGELLTQASFMVKNNDKQFQRFVLPPGASFWSCYVNGQPAKPERDSQDNALLVPLPRGANRDEAFAVDIVYAETKAALTSRWGQTLQLRAPQTDVPNTYAEWQLYVPASQRLSDFGGSMSVAQGTTYGALDAWKHFLAFYANVLREIGPGFFVIGLLAFLVLTLVVSAVRRGWNGVITVLAVLAILGVLGAMLLPALAKAKAKAQRISSVNNLKQIGLAARQFAMDNNDRLPVSFEEMRNELNTDKITYDPATGQRYVYLGAGLSLEELDPQSIIAYSPLHDGRCDVVLADGSVQSMTAAGFGEASQRGLIRRLPESEIALRKQNEAVMAQQFTDASVRRIQDNTLLMATNGVSTAGAITVAGTPTSPPKTTGLRSIRIEIPRTGTEFLFTKILNVRDEPLRVSARIMSLSAFQQRQMLAQVAAFVAGLVLLAWQWRGARNTFLLTVALTLMLGSVASLLIAWKALHDLLIIGFPLGALAVLAGLIWKFWPRHSVREETQAGPTELPPALAGWVLLLALSLAANPVPAMEPPLPVVPVSILNASYTGTVNDRVAQLEASIQVSAAQAGQTLPLFGADVAVQSFSAKPGHAKIIRDGETVSVVLPRKGDATLQLKLLVRLGGDVARRRLAFTVPAALTSRLTLTLEQPDADVEFPGAISFQRHTDQQVTRITALLGAHEKVELAWTPRVKRAAEVAATVMCQNSSLVSFGGGVFNVRSVLDYQVTQGELRQARVRLPAGHRLLRVEGESLRTWTTHEENDGHVLLVELLRGVSPNYRLTVETEQALATLPATATVTTPHALDVKRETGLIALRADEELELTVERQDGLQRVDGAAFTAADPGVTNLNSAFRFLKPDFALVARVAALQPQVEAVVRNHFRVGDDQLNLTATVDYTIKRAGVFALQLALPEDVRLEQVAGPNVLQWSERQVARQRLLEITLKERTTGAYALRVDLVRNLRELPKTLALAGVQPLGTQKLAGFISVSAEPGVSVKTAAFDGLTEIPVTALPGGGSFATESGALAFKFIADESGAATWRLEVRTETMAAWLRAEVASTVTLGDTLITGQALVRFDIQNAPVKELRLKVPAHFRNVEIAGANIRRRDQDGEHWRVALQSKVRGNYLLTVTWEQPRGDGTNLVELAGLSTEGVERETGTLAIAAKAPLQVTEVRAADLLKLDTREWPDWAGPASLNTALAYRYLRPGYQLAVEVRRFDEAEVLQALAESYRLTTVVAEDGQMMTEMSIAVRNNGRQHLEVALPAGAKVWSAFVAGQAVRPSVRAGKLLLPLENAGSDEAALTVELTYVSTNQFPARRGRVDLASPTLDVPLKNARWELYLPPDYAYDEFAGTMSRESGAGVFATASFSALEYSKQESDAKAEAQKGWALNLSSARQKLAAGKVKEAAAVINRYGVRGGRDDGVAKDLEAEVRRAQASNLVHAQQAFSFANTSVVAGNAPQPADQPASPGLNLNYDTAAAERQWEKLQQAQEVAVAKVRPLRVNLPTRGTRLSFAQVLQTETGKPLLVGFTADNLKTVSWPRRIGGGLLSFGVLWGLVAFVTARVGQSRPG